MSTAYATDRAPSIGADENGTSLAILRPTHADILARIQAVKDVIAKGCTDAELSVFAEVCRRTGLDPFSHQIYAIKRGDQMNIQTGIDGFRSKAEDTHLYVGQIGPQWCDADGEWHDVWLKNTPPVAARVGVLRADFKETLWGVARTEAYRVETNPLWKKMPDVMVAKCAEAGALRRAFPSQLGGLYIAEEMDQADNKPTPATAAPRTQSSQGDGRRVVEAGKPARTLAETRPLAAPTAEKPVPVTKDGKPDWGRARLAMQDIGVKTMAETHQFVADVLHIGLVAASDLRQLSMRDYETVMQAIENRLVDSALAADAAAPTKAERQLEAVDAIQAAVEERIEHDLHDLDTSGGKRPN
jgi:phage recombination protein Bet